MDKTIILKILCLTISIIFIGGCNALNTQQEESQYSKTDLEDVAEIEKQAREAYDNKNWTLAEQHYTELINILPNESEPWFRLGNIYARTNRHNAAINAYQQSLNLRPENTKAWNNLGIIQLREATNTFMLMQQHMQKDDPLHHRTNEVIEAMTELLEQGFSIKPEHTPDKLLKMDNDISK